MTKEQMADAYAKGFNGKYREVAREAFLCGYGAKCDIPADVLLKKAKEIACDVCKKLDNSEMKDTVVYYAILAALDAARWVAE